MFQRTIRIHSSFFLIASLTVHSQFAFINKTFSQFENFQLKSTSGVFIHSRLLNHCLYIYRREEQKMQNGQS